MAVPNLTRDDAAARAALLAVSSYDLFLDVTDGQGHPGEETFRSITTITFDARTPGAETFVDLSPIASAPPRSTASSST